MEDQDLLARIVKNLRAIATSDPRSMDYADEVIRCLQNRCFRAAIILSWNVLMYLLYLKIQEYGLNEFAKLICTSGRKLKGKINTLYDLNKLDDTDVLELAHEIGVYDRNAKEELKRMSQTRNMCAHVTQPVINDLKAFSFVSDVCNYGSFISASKFQAEQKFFVQSLLEFDDDAVADKAKSMSTQEITNAIDQVFDELALIPSWKEVPRYKPYFSFLKYAITGRKTTEDRIAVFKKIHQCYFAGGLSWASSEVFEVLRHCLTQASIRKYVTEKNLLDNYIDEFVSSQSYDSAGRRAEIVRMFGPYLTSEQIERVAEATCSNNQIYESYSAQDQLKQLFRLVQGSLPKKIKSKLRSLGLLD